LKAYAVQSKRYLAFCTAPSYRPNLIIGGSRLTLRYLRQPVGYIRRKLIYSGRFFISLSQLISSDKLIESKSGSIFMGIVYLQIARF